MTTIALTGATGFVGGTVLAQARVEGMSVRALTRRPQPPADGVEWIEGALDRPDALARLVRGADAVLHVAGVVNAHNREAFAAGNIDGTRAMLLAAAHEGIARFIQVSSLAAREPELSAYGWSKAEADRVVQGSNLDWTIVRPPAVYGPGDHEMLDLFRMARRGVVLLPPGGRLSVIHVADLARLLLTLARQDPGRLVLEPDDGVTGGWTHAAFGKAIGRAVGRRVVTVATPRAALALGVRFDRWFRGERAKLTADRAAYFCHPDWTAAHGLRPCADLWQPRIETREGLADTARWYRANGLL